MKNPPLKPWEIEHFSNFSLIFHMSLPKTWHAHPIKILFLKSTRIDLEAHKVLKLKIVASGSS